MSIAIFVGPTLPYNQVINYIKVPATIYPPIKRGDISSLSDQYNKIAIIDGVFHGDLSVSARELFLALKKGKKIFGCSSMGALRAAELNKFGMVGVGTIYQMYLKQTITSDGEVALIFSPETYENLTVPLVNIRYGINQAIQDNIISALVGDKLLEIAKSIHYTELDYYSLIKKYSLAVNNEIAKKFIDYITLKGEVIDLKKKDALELINLLNGY